MGARLINVLLGLWLFLSAFMWFHTPAQRATAWAVGILAVTAALAGFNGKKALRLFNAALGGWLVISAILLPHAKAATFWNHLIVGAALAFFGMMSRLSEIRSRQASVWVRRGSFIPPPAPVASSRTASFASCGART